MVSNIDAAAPIAVAGLSVAYPTGQYALENVSFSLPKGTICALVGMNGSGKSTLFKAIMGLVEPGKGSVRLDGEPPAKAHRRNLVAYVPQAEEVDWTFPVTVWDVVMMGRQGRMGFLRIPSAADREVARQCLARVGMGDLAQRQIGELSGGQRKRVFLARALAQEGRVMLLDEPFTGIDVTTEAAIVVLLRTLAAAGQTILVSTHNLGTVPEFCDAVLLLNRSVVAFGPTPTVFTAANLSRAFGGVLRTVAFDEPGGRASEVMVLTDDERPALFGRDGGTVSHRLDGRHGSH